MKILQQWFTRHFSDPEAVLLTSFLVIGFMLIMFWGETLAPVLASLILAYLLDGVVGYLQRFKISRLSAVVITYIGFLAFFLLAFLILLPLLWQQGVTFINDLPAMLLKGQHLLEGFVQRFPEFFSKQQVENLVSALLVEVRNSAKVVVSISWSSVLGLMTVVVYMVIVPLLIFFFLKDKQDILSWFTRFLPKERKILQSVSLELNQQFANYIRGKFIEIVIVGILTYIVFAIFGLSYAILLAFLVAISALIPYIGGIVVTIPVVLVAYLQWGFSTKFGYLNLAYLIIQGLETNVLVPLLFSEAVNLHPIAIVVSTLVFGSIWGFWGVFFAIPLATLLKAVLNAWPSAIPIAQSHDKI